MATGGWTCPPPSASMTTPPKPRSGRAPSILPSSSSEIVTSATGTRAPSGEPDRVAAGRPQQELRDVLGD